MTDPQGEEAELRAAVRGLREVRQIVSGGGRGAYDASTDQQRALAYCWVSIGSALKHHDRITGTAASASKFSNAIRFRDRLAHQPLDRLDIDILWESSVRSAPTTSC